MNSPLEKSSTFPPMSADFRGPFEVSKLILLFGVDFSPLLAEGAKGRQFPPGKVIFSFFFLKSVKKQKHIKRL